MNKICNKCKKEKNINQYQTIIIRKDDSINSDEEGMTHYIKETKLCLDCRNILKEQQRNIMTKKRSMT